MNLGKTVILKHSKNYLASNFWVTCNRKESHYYYYYYFSRRVAFSEVIRPWHFSYLLWSYPCNEDTNILAKHIRKYWHRRSRLNFLHWGFVEHLNYVKSWMGDAGGDQCPQELCNVGTVPWLWVSWFTPCPSFHTALCEFIEHWVKQ